MYVGFSRILDLTFVQRSLLAFRAVQMFVCLVLADEQFFYLLKENDLHVVSRLAPDIVILEIGTNDLTKLGPEIVGSAIEDLVVVSAR